MASLTGSLDGEKRTQLKAWFAAQKARRASPAAAETLSFPLAAADVFGTPAETTGGALGVDFVEARAPHTLVDVGALPESVAGRPRVKSTLRLAQRMGEGGIGAVVWNCGRALAHALPRLPEAAGGAFPAGTTVLELGCGTGLVGLACWLRGADATLTDLPDISPLAEENAIAVAGVDGALPPGLAIEPHAWGTPLSPSLEAAAPYDVVVGSDCLYDAKALPGLLKTLLATTDAKSVVYLAYKRRVEEREQPFFAELEAAFSDVALTKADAVPEAWRGTGLHVVRLAGKCPTPAAA